MMTTVFYHIILFLGDPILLGGFKPGDEVFDLSRADINILGAERTETSFWTTPMHAQCSLCGDILSSLDDSVEVYRGINWV